jgi:eukaryotic-like serine/threonine-protein kinase
VRESVPEPIAAAVNCALARAPADRFSSAAEFASALDAPRPTTVSLPAAAPAGVKSGVLRSAVRRPLALALLVGFAIGVGVLFAWRSSHGGDGRAAGLRRIAVVPF